MIMENSILSFIIENPEDKVSEIERVLNHNEVGDRVVVLVEGIDDETFYTEYLNTNNAYIYGMNGCEHFVNVLTALNTIYSGKLAVIKDADFDHLNNTTYMHHNLFLTDQHDYEMMLVTPQRVKSIAMQYGIRDEDAATIYGEVVDNISNYSYIKWYNSRRGVEEMGINFKSSKAIHHYGKSIEESLNLLRPFQNSGVVINQDEIESLKTANEDVDRRQLINGHDFCKLIPEVIKGLKRMNIKNKEIPAKLIDYYSKADFNATHLAQSLTRIFPNIVLK